MHIYTMGHSTMDVDEFIAILKSRGIQLLVDVRRFPTSAKFPHFSRESLSKRLVTEGLGYLWMGDLLGGMRKGWYEGYTQTEDFGHGLSRLEELASRQITCIMCAEKLYFRCHRRFISEKLANKGWEVVHIIEKERVYRHKTRKGEGS